VTESLPQIALTSNEVGEVLTHCGNAALLVGGQALAFWAARYAVEPVGVLAKGVTSDVDFIGSAKVAAALGRSLDWQLWVPAPNDPTRQVAKLTKTVPGVGIKQIDFLSAILGLQTSRVQQRAVKVTFPNGAGIRVLHPLDVLESRLRNIMILPSKQNAVCVAQAALATSIINRFLTSVIQNGEETRVIYDAIERIARIAHHKRLATVCVDNDLDPLQAVPVAIIPGDKFQSRRWQQIVKDAAKIRNQILDRAERPH
jgi:hypothetical protein